MTCGVPSISTVFPRRKRCFGKSVTMRHFNSPRTPCGASTWATTRNSGGLPALDDVEVDSGAFARGGGFDEGAEAADDSALAADDFADVFFVDFELVDGGVAILDLVDFDGVGVVHERLGDVLDEPLQVGLELLEVFLFVNIVVVVHEVGGGRLLFGHACLRRSDTARGQQPRNPLGRLGAALQPITHTV